MEWSLIKNVLPYLVSGIIGASIAWSIQGNRIDLAKLKTQECEANHDSYVNTQISQKLAREAEDRARSDKARQEYAQAISQLGEVNEKFAVYQRCVAAGKCGARMQYLPSSCSTNSISTPNGTDGTGTNPVPVEGGSAKEESVIVDCAISTYRLNYLQDLIEKQAGYTNGSK